MQWFRNMKIGVKLVLSFCLVALVAAVIGYTGVSNMALMHENAEQMYAERTVPIVELSNAEQELYELRLSASDLAVARDAGQRDVLQRAITLHEKQTEELVTKAGTTKLTGDTKRLYDEYRKSWEEFRPTVSRMVQLSLAGNERAAQEFEAGEFGSDSKKITEELDSLISAEETLSDSLDQEIGKEYNTATIETLIVLGIGVTLALGLGITIARLISIPVRTAVDAANRLAEGDLTVTIIPASRDEVGRLLEAMRLMVERLAAVVSEVKASADNVASGSQQLSSTSEQVSQGAVEQASSAEEASASTEQMVSNIRQNADNAHQTESIASRSAVDAREGGESVQQTVEAMKKIASKISIIEEIARQTNLLALNAAIEAARAGEHGKGFAVVASEVRKLAERSQAAAGEINQLAGSSVEVAVKAGEMLMKLVPDIQKTAELVQEISSASAEQSTGATQINKAIQQLDQVIQQNASASEEMSATSEELAAQAEELSRAVAFFKIKGSDQARTAAAPPRPHPAHPAPARKTPPKRQVPKEPPSSVAATPNGAIISLGGNGQDHADDADFEKY